MAPCEHPHSFGVWMFTVFLSSFHTIHQLTPLTKISPLSSSTKPQSASSFLVASGTWMRPLTPVLSMRLARFTVVPQMSYCGFVAPMTPAITGPWAMPDPIRNAAYGDRVQLLFTRSGKMFILFLKIVSWWWRQCVCVCAHVCVSSTTYPHVARSSCTCAC